MKNSKRIQPGREIAARSDAGFTLVELLVVITVIGILVSMMLPAVQAAREAVRRASCMNNLKQMGLASQSHISALGFYPGGGNCADAPSFDNVGNPCVGNDQDAGWMYQILPYLGLTTLWRKIPMASNPSQDDWLQREATPVSLYFCPSRRRPTDIKDSKLGGAVAMNDYAANGGTAMSHYGWYFANEGEDGPIAINRAPYAMFAGTGKTKNYPVVTPAAITKGDASTVLLGEKCINIDKLSVQFQDEDDGWVAGWDSDTSRWGMVPPIPDYHNAVEQEQSNGLGTTYDETHGYAFGSSHTSSSNYTMCDGSVRSISYGINPLVFEYLCSRNIRNGDPTLQQALQNGAVSPSDVGKAGF